MYTNTISTHSFFCIVISTIRVECSVSMCLLCVCVFCTQDCSMSACLVRHKSLARPLEDVHTHMECTLKHMHICVTVHLWMMNFKYQRLTQETGSSHWLRCVSACLFHVNVTLCAHLFFFAVCLCVFLDVSHSCVHVYWKQTLSCLCSFSHLQGPLSVFIASGLIASAFLWDCV